MKQQVFTFTQLGHDHANLSSNYLLNWNKKKKKKKKKKIFKIFWLGIMEIYFVESVWEK
jgi:hypothetical protein